MGSGSKKPATQTQTSTSTTVNNYSYQTPPETQEIKDAKASAAKLKGRVNPMIRGYYAGERERLNDQFHNPIGSYTTPAIREASLKAGNEELSQAEAAAIASADFLEGDADFQRQLAIAGLTMPHMGPTGSTTTTNSSMTGTGGSSGGGIVNGVLSAGATIGSAAIM